MEYLECKFLTVIMIVMSDNKFAYTSLLLQGHLNHLLISAINYDKVILDTAYV